MNRCASTRGVLLLLLSCGALQVGALCLGAGRADGDTATPLTTDPTIDNFPSWSPDGTRIAFTRDTALNPTLYLLTVASGSTVQLLGNFPGVVHPTWSPDGSTLMYSRLGVLWSLPLAGGINSQITSPLDGATPDEAPAWSSTGKIAIQTKFGSEANFAIGTVTASGGVTARLTPPGAACTWPSWSPDGGRFVYTSGTPGDLLTRGADGQGELPLVTWASNEVQPEWSPRGGWVAFASTASGNSDIWIIPAAGGDAIQITDDPAIDLHPTWSPDETRIAFTSTRSGDFDLWVIDVSSLPTRATSWSAIKGGYAE